MGAPRALLALPGVWELLAERTPGEGLHGEGFAGVPAVRVLTRYVPWAYRGWGPNMNGYNVQRVKSRVSSVLTYLLTCAGGRAGVAASDTLVVGAGLGHARLVGLRLRLLRKYK